MRSYPNRCDWCGHGAGGLGYVRGTLPTAKHMPRTFNDLDIGYVCSPECLTALRAAAGTVEP